MVSQTSNGTLRVYYDGDCPLCSREIAWLKRRVPSEKVEFKEIATIDFTSDTMPRSYEELMSEIHAERSDGEWIKGMEVFRELYSHLRLGFLLRPTGWPILRPIFDSLYRIFARNRMRLTGRCARNRCN